ncbi:MAG: alpha/beta fold hydrolase [Burkholderiales bacterium]|nr:alpha/beta fold hydrolase [Burkholderiales bacterium]
MPRVRIDADLMLHYAVDDYTDPWRTAQTAILLHGLGESGAVWFGWVPELARELRVVRPDMRGFGASTPMPKGFAWSVDLLVADCLALADALGCARIHLVGAKLAGSVARAFAARHPDRMHTLTVVGSPPPLWPGRAERLPALIAELRRLGVARWAREGMASRLGDRFPAAGMAWWSDLMGRTDLESQVGFMTTIECADIRAELARIACPTLVITSEASGVASVEQTRAWARSIARSELCVVPGNSYHVAASDPDRCARETLAFIRRHQ